MYGRRPNSTRSQFSGEKNVGGFGLSIPRPSVIFGSVLEIVIIRSKWSKLGSVAGKIDDSGALTSSLDLGKQQRCEEEVTKMVGGKLKLNIVLIGAEFGQSHDTGIVDHDVQFFDGFINCICSLTNRIEISKIDRDEGDLDGRVEVLDFGFDGCNFGLGASK